MKKTLSLGFLCCFISYFFGFISRPSTRVEINEIYDCYKKEGLRSLAKRPTFHEVPFIGPKKERLKRMNPQAVWDYDRYEAENDNPFMGDLGVLLEKIKLKGSKIHSTIKSSRPFTFNRLNDGEIMLGNFKGKVLTTEGYVLELSLFQKEKGQSGPVHFSLKILRNEEETRVKTSGSKSGVLQAHGGELIFFTKKWLLQLFFERTEDRYLGHFYETVGPGSGRYLGKVVLFRKKVVNGGN